MKMKMQKKQAKPEQAKPEEAKPEAKPEEQLEAAAAPPLAPMRLTF
jgi:hypothetical protein